MTAKVVRIPLISITEELNYQTVCKELFKIQDDIRKIKNKTIQLNWEWQNFSNEYHKEHGIRPQSSEFLRLKTLRGDIDSLLRKEYPNLYSGNLSIAVKNADNDFKNASKDIWLGTKSIIEYRSNQPIDLHNNTIKIYYQNNIYTFSLNIFSREYKNVLGLRTTELHFKAHNIEKYQIAILERCYTNEYKIAESKLIYNKKKKQWFLNLSYKFEQIKSTILDKDKIMGVDLGICNAAYLGFNHCLNRYSIEGNEIESFRKQIEKRKRSLQRQGKFCGDGRIGHGIKTRIKPLETLSKTVANFRDTINHKYSKFIVDMAIKHECGTIQLENLQGVTKDNLFLKDWTYYDLQEKIIYKAREKGIEVCLIKPEYTSQRCSKCGFISEENRKTQADFKCLSCGFEANADYNASLNIATKDIEKIIADTLKMGGANIK